MQLCNSPHSFIINSIPGLPPVLKEPIYGFSKSKLRLWALKTGINISKDPFKILKSLDKALDAQKNLVTLK